MKRNASLIGAFLILAIAPFFYTTFMRDIFMLSKTLPLSVGAAILFASLIYRGEVALYRRMLTPAILVLFGATILSALFTVDGPLSLMGPHQSQFHALLPMALYATIYYASANSESLSPRTLVLMALIGGVAVCIPAFTQVIPSKYTFMAWTIQGGRAGSTLGSPIFLGAYLAMLLPLAWDKFAPETNTIRKIAWLIVAAVLVAGIAASRSRGSLIAGACGVILVDLLRGYRKRAMLMVGLSALAAAVLFYMRGAIRSDIGRIEVYRAAFQAFKQHPIFGWGPDTFGLAFRQFMSQKFVLNEGNDISIQVSAHNDFIQALVTTGVIGLMAYCYFLTGVLRSLRKSVKASSEAVGIAGAALALFINAKFNPVPLAVFSVMACLLGSLDRWVVWSDSEPRSKLRAAGVAAASCALVVVFGVMARAEYHQRNGENLWQMGYPVQAAEQFNIAAKINPFDLWYTQRQLDYFWKVIGHMPNTNRQTLASFSHNVAQNVARLHPADPTAHELISISYEFEGDMLFRDRYWEAFNEIIVSERLSPNFTSYSKRVECVIHRAKAKDTRPCYDQGSQRAAKS